MACQGGITLVDTAGTFYMLQACMQGNFLKNLENSDCAQGKNFEKFPCILEDPVSMSLHFEKKSLQPLKFLKNLQAVFKETH